MKRILYTGIVFLMFVSPFLIISKHLSNTVDELSLNYNLSLLEYNINNISSIITSNLIERYDVLKNIRGLKGEIKVDRIKELAKIDVVKKISYYSLDGNLIYSTDTKEKKKRNDDLFQKAKNLNVPIGFVSYPENMPCELTTIERIKNGIFIVVTDLGYLNETLSRITKKTPYTIYLVDSSNYVIFDSFYNFLFTVGLKSDDEISKLIDSLKSKNIFNYKSVINIRGKDYIIAISNVDTTTWWVYGVMERSKLINFGLKSWVRRVVISGIILILFFSYITLLIYEKVYSRDR